VDTVSRRPFLGLSEEERVARLRSRGFGPDLLPLNLTPAERQAATDRKAEAVTDPVTPVPVVAKTPVLSDKRLITVIVTSICLFASAVFKLELPVEIVTAIVTLVLGWVTNSAMKEAAVAKSLAATTPEK
jgi:hypothetical protein